MDFLNEQSTITNTKPVRWIGISNGYFVMKTDETNPKAKKRINKLGNEVYELFFASIGPVKIKTLTFDENKFGEKNIYVGVYNPEIKMDMDTVITIKMESSYGRSFLQQIFNIDLTKTISFNPWSKTDDEGKKTNRLYINYGDREKVKMAYPTGTPEVIFHDIKGKKIVDVVSQAKQADFLEERLELFSKSNNMWVEKKVEPQSDLGEGVDTSEPTAEELAELKRKKQEMAPKQDKGTKSKMIESTQDDFFNENFN